VTVASGHLMNAGARVGSPARPNTSHSAGPQDDRLACGFHVIDRPSSRLEIMKGIPTTTNSRKQAMRRFVSDTQREYIRAVKRLAAFLPFLGHRDGGRVARRAFQLSSDRDRCATTDHQRDRDRAASTGRRRRAISCSFEPRKLPCVLSPEEVFFNNIGSKRTSVNIADVS
jgi:hypothetical protein